MTGRAAAARARVHLAGESREPAGHGKGRARSGPRAPVPGGLFLAPPAPHNAFNSVTKPRSDGNAPGRPAAATSTSLLEGRSAPIPVGPRLEAVLELAYRARRAVLL